MYTILYKLLSKFKVTINSKRTTTTLYLTYS